MSENFENFLARPVFIKNNESRKEKLHDHSLNVAEKAVSLLSSTRLNEFTSGELSECYIAGLFHDAGKSASGFQDWTKQDPKENTKKKKKAVIELSDSDSEIDEEGDLGNENPSIMQEPNGIRLFHEEISLLGFDFWIISLVKEKGKVKFNDDIVFDFSEGDWKVNYIERELMLTQDDVVLTDLNEKINRIRFAILWHHKEGYYKIDQEMISNRETSLNVYLKTYIVRSAVHKTVFYCNYLTSLENSRLKIEGCLSEDYKFIGDDSLKDYFNSLYKITIEAGRSTLSSPFLKYKSIQKLSMDDKNTKGYRDYKEIITAASKKNASRLLLKSIIVTADREVVRQFESINNNNTFPIGSSESFKKNFEEYMETETKKKMLTNDRSVLQKAIANDLIKLSKSNPKTDICVETMIAGGGKTLLSQILTSKLIEGDDSKLSCVFYITPRNIINTTLLDSILGNTPTSLRVLSITGEGPFTKKIDSDVPNYISLNDKTLNEHDVVILSIDQFQKMLSSHKFASLPLKLLNSLIIFDEFHEFIGITNSLAVIYETIFIKKHSEFPMIALSATQDIILNEHLLETNGVSVKSPANYETNFEEVLKLPDFTRNYRISKNEDQVNLKTNSEVLDESFKQDHFMSVSTIPDAQAVSLNKGIMCLTSALTPHDRALVLGKLNELYGKKGSASETPTETKFVAGPILRSSVDIGVKGALVDKCSIYNLLQIIGRVDRFNIYNEKSKKNESNDLPKITLYNSTGASKIEGLYPFGVLSKASSEFIDEESDIPKEGKDVSLGSLYKWKDRVDAKIRTLIIEDKISSEFSEDMKRFLLKNYNYILYPSTPKKYYSKSKKNKNFKIPFRESCSMYINPMICKIEGDGDDKKINIDKELLTGHYALIEAEGAKKITENLKDYLKSAKASALSVDTKYLYKYFQRDNETHVYLAGNAQKDIKYTISKYKVILEKINVIYLKKLVRRNSNPIISHEEKMTSELRDLVESINLDNINLYTGDALVEILESFTKSWPLIQDPENVSNVIENNDVKGEENDKYSFVYEKLDANLVGRGLIKGNLKIGFKNKKIN